ncbi:hypothetical protein [Bradyrhizobium sp. DASA03120]|uniref:hypothetical protein n=1 Tax=Bradyrhizobium sp. SMVTL-02 TaxID=3395917 RepID=UPI003F72BB47
MPSDFIALAQTVLATNAHHIAADSVTQLAVIGFAVMENAARERIRSEMELDRIARERRAEK